MLTLPARNQIVIGGILGLLMVATRGQHFASLYSLPGASWAVFFLAGVYLRNVWSLAALLALSWIVDFAAYYWGGASSFCITPAYVFLLPAYSALWLAGRWYSQRHQFEWRTLLPLAAATLVGAVACELFSSGGFYFFSGRIAEPTFSAFIAQELQYFPAYFQSLAFYIGMAAVVHALFGLMNGTNQHHDTITH
ncbi:MAG: hypothetical protein R6X06_03030 [Gammaproteobacteria bacterium]